MQQNHNRSLFVHGAYQAQFMLQSTVLSFYCKYMTEIWRRKKSVDGYCGNRETTPPPLSPISYVSSSPDPSCSEKKNWCCVTFQVKRCLQYGPELSTHSFAAPADQLAPPLWIRNCHCSNVHCSVLC